MDKCIQVRCHSKWQSYPLISIFSTTSSSLGLVLYLKFKSYVNMVK
uniref:Uncharacterized protein n=1 Tax=Anguilla anguilla TaxID=7936 RepID=A0A0E9SS96_ANGAN